MVYLAISNGSAGNDLGQWRRQKAVRMSRGNYGKFFGRSVARADFVQACPSEHLGKRYGGGTFLLPDPFCRPAGG